MPTTVDDVHDEEDSYYIPHGLYDVGSPVSKEDQASSPVGQCLLYSACSAPLVIFSLQLVFDQRRSTLHLWQSPPLHTPQS